MSSSGVPTIVAISPAQLYGSAADTPPAGRPNRTMERHEIVAIAGRDFDRMPKTIAAK